MPSSIGTTATSSETQGEKKISEQDDDRSLEIKLIRADGGMLWCGVRRGCGHLYVAEREKEFEKMGKQEAREPAVLPSVLGTGFFHTQPKNPSLSFSS